MADALPDGIVVVDPAGTIVSINHRMVKMTGYAEDDLLGHSIDRLVPSDRRASHALRRTEFSARPVVRPMGTELDTVCQRSDGTLFPADIALSPMALDGERFVVATVRAANGARALDDARREAEERFRLVMERASDLAIFTLDAEGRASSWNLGAQRLEGYERGEIIGQPITVLDTPEDIALHTPERLLAEAAATGRAEEPGWRVRKDGSKFEASVSITASVDSDRQLRGLLRSSATTAPSCRRAMLSNGCTSSSSASTSAKTSTMGPSRRCSQSAWASRR